MFWSKNNKNRFTPAYPSFAVGFNGVYMSRTCFPDAMRIAKIHLIFLVFTKGSFNNDRTTHDQYKLRKGVGVRRGGLVTDHRHLKHKNHKS